MSTIETDKIHVGQIGAIITLNIKKDVNGVKTAVDLTGTTSQFKFFNTLGTLKKTATATIIGDPTQGILRYTENEGIFDSEGEWQVQAIITYSATKVIPTSFLPFTVEA